MDIEAEREKITKEIKELERILDPSSSGIHVEVSESSLDSDSEADSLPCEDVEAADPPFVGEERWGEASNEEEDLKDRALPEDPETCLQLNMVYQEVVQEKLAEVSLLLAQNREQQEEILGDLAGSRGPRVKDGKSLPPNMYIGHFMKPYFKDKVTGVGPPANEETREKAAQGIKAFEQLLVTKWKLWEKALLRKSVVSDRLQRLLQPKLLKLEYLRQKQSRVSSEPERQVLEKQVGEAEQEIRSINQLPEEALLGSRLDSHDWEKISNVHFEGSRSAEEIRKFWQSFEHPSINKQEWSAEEVQRLKAIAATHGHLEWHLVAEELGTRRSAFQCLQKFQQHNKALKRTEWTEEEDHMLTQLVQEMRVGSHIPYRRIVYYMEGRDSMQLIYRWTKSLDPSLKRGSWAPEEDAKLLQAVAKYGEQDWFKIREEVPGRSDAQCRDRYLRRLHFSLKKGRWAADEEQRLRELIEKHGAGHWARIASELPHRSGSQCLSKWKAMAGKRQGQQRRRRRPCHRVQWSSGSSSDSDSGRSSSDSSSSSGSSEGSEAELEEPRKGRGLPLPPQYVVPDIDLWVPARQSSESGLPPRGGAGGCSGRPSAPTGPPKGSDVTPGCDKEAPASALAAGELSQNLAPVGRPTTARPAGAPADSQAARLEEPACEQERLRQAPLPGSPPGPGPGDSTAGPHLRQLRHRTSQNGQRRRRRALQRRLLEHRLLLAVTPWVSQGEVTLPCPPTPAAVHTRADGIRMQLENAHLASTPVFTLLIQLLQIDAKGCMEVVRERKAQPPALPQPGLRGPPPRPQQAPVSAQRTPGCPLPHVPAQGPGKSTSHRASPGLQPPSSRVPVPAPCGPRPKPKTVSELLREKRLREAHAKKAAQGPTVLRPPLLVSSPVILQPPLLPAPRGAPVGASPCPSGSCPQPGASAKDRQLPTPQALALSLTPGPSQGPVGCPPSGEGQPLLPAAPSPTQPPAQPRGLTPTLGTPRAGSPLPASISLPVTWVLTAQGLLPVPVPAVVGLPGPGETPCPPGLPAALPPPPHGTHPCPPQPPAGVSAEPAPGSRTEPSVPPSRPPPQSAAEVGGDAPCAPGEVQVAGETPQPKTPSRAHCPGAEPPVPSQLPGHGGTGPRADPAGTLVSGPVPLGLEKPPLPGPEKGALALGLLSLGSEAAAREWLRGQRGVSLPPLGSRLPYQPPGLCSLRALATLLRHKKALEHQAAALVAGGAAGPGPGALQASLELVRGQLRDNPAFLLLKARFLAAFALPGLLATLAPRGVRTTLSVARRAGPESEDESEAEELGDRNGQPGCTASRKQPGPATASPPQGAVDPGEGPAPSCLDGPGDLDVLRTRHSRHPRRRRWPL